MTLSRHLLLGAFLVSFFGATPVLAERPGLLLASLGANDTDGATESLTSEPAGAAAADESNDMIRSATPPATRWSVWVGAVFLQRSTPTSQPLVEDWNGPLLNANQLNFATQAGPDLNALWHREAFDLDFRYFDVRHMGATTIVQPTTDYFFNLRNPVTPAPLLLGVLRGLPAPLLPQPVTFGYRSSLQSVEANFRQNVTQYAAILAGFRYLSLRDDLGADYEMTSFYPRPRDLHMIGINRLYGGQVGTDTILWHSGPWQVQTAIKAGLFGNSAQSMGQLNDDQSYSRSFSLSRSLLSFVGDISVSGECALTEHLTIRAGYQLLWLTGVALGSDQYATNSYVPTDGASVADGDVFFHGALVSLQASW
jgi:hypothetical protein